MKESSSDLHEVGLAEGKSWSITLPGLGSAGYVWEHRIEGRDDVVSLAREPSSEPELPPTGSEPPPAYSRDEVLTLTGLRPGRATVILRQRRPWEADKPALREIVLEVEVGP